MLIEAPLAVPVTREVEADEVLAVLRGARDRVARGWYQGWFCDETKGRVCTWGALNWAASGIPEEAAPLSYLAAEYVGKAIHSGDVAAFNDRPSTTHNDVLNAFDRAIQLRRSELDETPPSPVVTRQGG